MKPETEQVIAAMWNAFPASRDMDRELTIRAYRSALSQFNDGAIQKIATRYLTGYCGRENKTFCPSLAEFTDAVRKENGFWIGSQPRPLQTGYKSLAYQGNPDRETLQEKWRRKGREVMAEWDKEHGYDYDRDPANKTPLFHERMAELRSRVSGNIAGVVVQERKKA